MGLGVSIKLAEEQPPEPQIGGLLDWLKVYWPWLGSGALGTALIINLLKRRK